MPRKALGIMTMVNVYANGSWEKMVGTHNTITLLEIAKNASLGKSMHAPQARMSKAVPEKYSGDSLFRYFQCRAIKVHVPSPEVSPLMRRQK